jgi:hypothetical protein
MSAAGRVTVPSPAWEREPIGRGGVSILHDLFDKTLGKG